MPLKLIKPREGKSPNWSIRGTHLKVYVDRSSGTDRQALARRILRDLEQRIERGEFRPDPEPAKTTATYLSGAVAFMKTGGERRFQGKLIQHFGEMPLDQIDQAKIDAAAILLYPNAGPATRNRKVYSPVSAVLHYANIDIRLRRPKGSKGRVITDFMSPEDAAAIIGAAERFNPEFALLLRFLLYTGVRIGEAIRLQWEDTVLADGYARIGRTKNGDPRPMMLRADLCAELEAHRAGRTSGQVFNFRQGGGLKDMMVRARVEASGQTMPKRDKSRAKGSRKAPWCRLHWVHFHTFRHTWATWMRRYGGLDIQGLVANGNWRGSRSASRYVHAVARDEWTRVETLPQIKRPA